MKKGSKLYWFITIIVIILAIAINGYIIMHSCLDAAESTKASSSVVEVAEDVVNTVRPETITPENHDSFASFIRKAFGHFGLFAVSGLLTSLALYLSLSPFSWSKHYINVMFSLVVGLFMGIITEMIQLTVPGRSGQVTDVIIDFSGYLLGTLIIGLILFLIIRKLRKKKSA